MRICSLLPSATEVIASLGLGDELVGISHECDYPPSIRHLPIMVEPMIPSHGLASAAIDTHVRQLVASGQRLYRLKDQLLRQAQPELILSQDLCMSVPLRRTNFRTPLVRCLDSQPSSR